MVLLMDIWKVDQTVLLMDTWKVDPMVPLKAVLKARLKADH
jgi:hypothetical protein